MKKTLFIGVDPGLAGGIALFDPERRSLVAVIDMPLIHSKKVKPALNAISIANFIGSHKKHIQMACLETVGTRPGQNAGGVLRYGFMAGVIEGIVYGYGVPVMKVIPRTWKKQFNLSADKNKSRFLAQELFPKDQAIFDRVKDDGRAEAALLSVYGHLCWLRDSHPFGEFS